MKDDKHKPRMELLPMDTLLEVAKVLTFGADKYEPNGWKQVEKDRYVGALLRHIAALQMGHKIDKESGLLHAAHIACNALFILHFEIEEAKNEIHG